MLRLQWRSQDGVGATSGDYAKSSGSPPFWVLSSSSSSPRFTFPHLPVTVTEAKNMKLITNMFHILVTRRRNEIDRFLMQPERIVCSVRWYRRVILSEKVHWAGDYASGSAFVITSKNIEAVFVPETSITLVTGICLSNLRAHFNRHRLISLGPGPVPHYRPLSLSPTANDNDPSPTRFWFIREMFFSFLVALSNPPTRLLAIIGEAVQATLVKLKM